MKTKLTYFCSECGNETSKWYGKCPACGAWNSLVEEESVTKPSAKTNKLASGSSAAAPSKLDEITLDSELRFSTGLGEFDRVLGGGLVAGSLVLVGGDPGIGKSTLLLQICQTMHTDGKILYISGEESARQLKMRAHRLGVTTERLYIVSQVNTDYIVKNIDELSPSVVIVDSIQTMYSPTVTSAPGSVSQVRDVTMTLMRKAKEDGISIFVVGHVTKDGGIAGPKVLEHMVDCVLYFEGERHQNYRVLRGVKNRFGSTNEIGVFEMFDTGLHEVLNPSAVMLEDRPQDVAGASVICALEGSRPLLAEIQALVATTSFGMPRRTANGLDYNRIAMLIAVLEKRVGMNLSNQDAYVNVVGGIKIEEPAADLGVILALASSFRSFSLPKDMVFIGEVGLTGEIRAVNRIEQRLSEIEKLGFRQCMLPHGNKRTMQAVQTKLELIPVKSVAQALALVRD